MAKIVQSSVLAAVARCLDSGKYSDLTIQCGNDVHKVHKMILCTQSDFFAGAVRFQGKESEQSKIDLPEDEPAIVKLLVKYLYTGDYKCAPQESSTLPNSAAVAAEKSCKTMPDSSYTYQFPHSCSSYYCEAQLCPHHICRNNCCGACRNFNCQYCPSKMPNLLAKNLLVHAKVYEIADKYNIADLKDLSKEKFRAGCEGCWNSDTFPVAAQYAFSTTVEEDKGLRDIVISIIAKHTSLMKKPEVQVLMKEFGSLPLGVLLKKGSDHGWF